MTSAIAAAQRALALATTGGEVVLQALANQRLGSAYLDQGDYCRAIDCFRQTVASLDGARRHERFGQAVLPAVNSRAWLVQCHAELGLFAEGRALGDEGLRIAEAVVHPGSLMFASWGIGLLSLRQGDLHRALPLLERAVCICHEADFPALFPWIAAALGAAYTLSGRVADAVPLLTQALEQTIATGMVGYQALCRLSLGEAQLLAGRLEEARALAERALALAREHQERGTPGLCPTPPRRDRRASRSSGRRHGRRPLPPGPRPGRGAGHAPAPGALPPRPGHAVCHDRPARAGPHRVIDGHRDVPSRWR